MLYNNIRGVKAFGHFLRRIMPSCVFRLVLRAYHRVLSVIEEPLSWYALWRVRQRVGKLRSANSPIRFGFYVVLPSMFQWRRVFELMLKDDRFEPFIVVTPRIGWQVGDMEATMEKAYSSLVADYGTHHVFKGYHDGMFENCIEDCDACAMMNLYSGLAERSFEVVHFALRGVPVFGSCYFYDPGTVHSKEYYSMRSLKFVRKFFCSNNIERDKFIKYQKCQMSTDRVEVSGCPKADAIFDIVKSNPSSRKVILLAPHHSVIPTLDSGLCLGNFLKYKDFLLNLPRKYPQIDWIFRPHPHLKLNLVKNVGWAEDQWNAYVKSFVSNSNAIYEDDGPYYESFAKSDAIIHDCCSFLSEYFYTGKPPCYLLASKAAKEAQFDTVGQTIVSHTYEAYNEGDVLRFIDEVVIGGRDTNKDEREKFAHENLMVNYPHASQYIVDSIAKLLGRSKKD